MNKNPEKLHCAIVGYGKVGNVLSKALVQKGYPLAGVVLRQRRRDVWLESLRVPILDNIADLAKEVDFVVLCVRDRQIQELAHAIVECGGFKTGTVVAHTAGAVSSEIVNAVREVDALPLTWHPMQTFIGDDDSRLLQGVTFGIDGDPIAVEIGERIARELGGIPYHVPPGKRAVYHLSAVIACNLMSGLFSMAMKLLGEAGMDENRAQQTLSPLIARTARNIAEKGLPQAISGPHRRGDEGTILSHLDILKKHPEIEMVYRWLSIELIEQLDSEEIAVKIKPLLEKYRM